MTYRLPYRLPYRPEVFTIELHGKNDARRPAPPVYYPGSTIAGNVVIKSSQIMKPLHQITVKLSGVAFIRWEDETAERTATGTRIIPITCTDTETTLELSAELWDVAGNRTTTDGLPRQLVGLPSGNHKFPFMLQLPANLDLKLPSSLETGGYCFIRYLLTAGISQTTLFKFDHSVSKTLSLSACIDVNVPKLLQPLSGSQEKTACCMSGSTVLTAQTDRRGYCPGESIAVSVEVENLRATGIYARATLKQKIQMCGQPYYRNGRPVDRDVMYKTMYTIIKTMEGLPNWRNKLLVIPILPPTIAKCQPIKVSYSLEVTFNGLFVELPIVIGTIPYRGPVGSTMPTPDDPSVTDFVRENYIQYQAIQYISQLRTSTLNYMPIYGYVQHYRFAPADWVN